MNAYEIIFERRNKAIHEADRKTDIIQALSPEILSIDNQLVSNILRLYQNNTQDVVDECMALRSRRNEILASLGFPDEYDKPKYRCCKCNDTGFVKLEKCECMKSLEAEIFLNDTAMGKGLSECTFESFSLSYCTDASMKSVLEACRKYAEGFTRKSKNLILYGGTGLGKTHLSAAIGYEVIKKGYSVVYESATKIISDCKTAMFSSEDNSQKYYQCDLLIMDDLGVENKSEYTITALTEIINKRIVSRKQTIITTNYDLPEINKIYGGRVFSRLIGEFTPIHFVGKDVRMMKIK
ncbi:MAG: ATP-binding protein [Sphaerochaetaceae bacterium]